MNNICIVLYRLAKIFTFIPNLLGCKCNNPICNFFRQGGHSEQAWEHGLQCENSSMDIVEHKLVGSHITTENLSSNRRRLAYNTNADRGVLLQQLVTQSKLYKDVNLHSYYLQHAALPTSSLGLWPGDTRY